MPIAACMIREQVHYRREAFVAGLERCGYTVQRNVDMRPGPRDVLVIWNRYEMYDAMARQYEAAGAAVLVVENGWFGQDADGRKYYAIARSHHNGAGSWYVGEEDRWSPLGVELKPWRRDGSHILVLPQRGIGPNKVKMPLAWPRSIERRLREATKRPIRVRPHPGKERPPLEPDLEDCWAAVTWGSGAAIQAIAAGIPVFYELERWIGAPAARFGIADLEAPFVGDRLPMFSRLAWHQWDLSSIRAGEPFRWLLAQQAAA